MIRSFSPLPLPLQFYSVLWRCAHVLGITQANDPSPNHHLVLPQSILHASLEHNALSLEKFSRWLRAICTILLSRDSNADRPRAIGFVEQAIGVLKEQRDVEVRVFSSSVLSERGAGGSMCIMVNVTESIRLRKTPLLFRLHSCSYPDPLTNRVPGQGYPIEERQWLLGTTYNTGIECLQFVPFLCYHPPILDPSMPSRMSGASIRPSAYSILVSPVSEHGL